MKSFQKSVFAMYLLLLLWLVLFKFSFDITDVLFNHQASGINLIPFADSHTHLREMIDNVAVFIPFGLLLSVLFTRLTLWRKLGIIAGFSATVELLQFVLAIGLSDITDVIANTFGGLIGLVTYKLAGKYIDHKKLDVFICAAGLVLMAAFLVWRTVFLKVRY